MTDHNAGLRAACALPLAPPGEDELRWLSDSGGIDRRPLGGLAGFRSEGHVEAMPKGSVFFTDEPTLRVTAPTPVAQLVETRLMNQTLVASKPPAWCWPRQAFPGRSHP